VTAGPDGVGSGRETLPDSIARGWWKRRGTALTTFGNGSPARNGDGDGALR
jgi:hypothetical protein